MGSDTPGFSMPLHMFWHTICMTSIPDSGLGCIGSDVKAIMDTHSDRECHTREELPGAVLIATSDEERQDSPLVVYADVT